MPLRFRFAWKMSETMRWSGPLPSPLSLIMSPFDRIASGCGKTEPMVSKKLSYFLSLFAWSPTWTSDMTTKRASGFSFVLIR